MSRHSSGNSRRRSGIAARTSSKAQSTSARLRSSNNTVSENGHDRLLKQIKDIKLEYSPVCEGTGCGCSLLREDYSGTIYADHRIPVSQGGQTTLGNVQLLCYNCHMNKLGSKNRKGRSLLKANNKYATQTRRKSHESTRSQRGDNWRNYE